MDRTLYWASVVLSVGALLLLGVNTALVGRNRDLQGELGRRQAFINQINDAAALNQNLANALASLAIKNNDAAVRDLLASQGITLKANSKTLRK